MSESEGFLAFVGILLRQRCLLTVDERISFSLSCRERCPIEVSHPVIYSGRGHELPASEIIVLMNYSLVIGDARITRQTALVQRVRIRPALCNVIQLPFCFLLYHHICAVRPPMNTRT